MKSFSARKFIKILENNDFVLARQKGSHKIFKHLQSGIMVPVSTHGGNKPIPIGTFLQIVKQSRIPRDQFK